MTSHCRFGQGGALVAEDDSIVDRGVGDPTICTVVDAYRMSYLARDR